jgi:hypothetical protein
MNDDSSPLNFHSVFHKIKIFLTDGLRIISIYFYLVTLLHNARILIRDHGSPQYSDSN